MSGDSGGLGHYTFVVGNVDESSDGAVDVSTDTSDDFDGGPVDNDKMWVVDFKDIKFKKKLGSGEFSYLVCIFFQGAFGQVSMAKLWGTKVAVKQVKQEHTDPNIIEGFKHEALILR